MREEERNKSKQILKSQNQPTNLSKWKRKKREGKRNIKEKGQDKKKARKNEKRKMETERIGTKRMGKENTEREEIERRERKRRNRERNAFFSYYVFMKKSPVNNR